ncbi:MAG: DUF2520 domain-containing protein [Myxococcota bacterium]|nr:DUF2520 domain-containing protein [Myxococcota bacterium]
MSGHLPAASATPDGPRVVSEVALFGGSFDPPQIAHLLVGAYILGSRPGELWLMPSAHHPFGKRLVPFTQRLRLCQRLAELLGPRARVTPIEEELGGSGRTIDTLRELQRRHPGQAFRLVIGSDILGERHAWKSWDEVCRLAPPILIGREGYPVPPGFTPEITLPGISSTEVRRRLTTGEPLDGLVPFPIIQEIQKLGLYSARTPAAPPPRLDPSPAAVRPGLALLGVGRAGLTLALALRAAGWPPTLLWDRDATRAAAVASLWGAPVLTGPPPPALREVPCWLIAVPDAAIAGLAAELAAAGLVPAAGVALHTSGVLSSRALHPLAAQGMAVGSLHPLAPLTDPLVARGCGSAAPHATPALAGAGFGVEASTAAAAQLARELTSALAGRPLILGAGDKAAYHAGAALAANGLVTLLHDAQRLVSPAIGDPDAALAALVRLASLALAEVERQGPAAALTGPIRRGDEPTVRLHLQALRDDPALRVYRELGLRTLALARQAGAPAEALDRITQLLVEPAQPVETPAAG